MTFERVTSVILVLVGVVIAGALISREIRTWGDRDGPSSQQPALSVDSVSSVHDWDGFTNGAARIGPRNAPVQLVEFTDLECPYCKRFHASFSRIEREFGDSISLVVMHFPLSSHRFAMPAARAAECARSQGRFQEFVDAVFTAQDSLGLKSWAAYASSAGVADTILLQECIAAMEPDSLISAMIGRGEELAVRTTPTIFVNGWKFSIPPTETQLRSAIRGLLDSGRIPSFEVR